MKSYLKKQVTAAIIQDDSGKYLIAQRAAGDALAWKWEFPGGKMEPNESPEECVKREIIEELGVTIHLLEYFATSVFQSENGELELLVFGAKIAAGTLRCNVHARLEWVDKADFSKYDFAPADVPIVQKLLQAGVET